MDGLSLLRIDHGRWQVVLNGTLLAADFSNPEQAYRFMRSYADAHRTVPQVTEDDNAEDERILDIIHAAPKQSETEDDGEPTTCIICAAPMKKRNTVDRLYQCVESWGHQVVWPKLEFPRSEDISGRRFGRWLVLSYSGARRRRHYWNCLCDCGTRKVVRGVALLGKQSTSCGCARKEASADRWRDPACAERMAHGGRPPSKRAVSVPSAAEAAAST